MELTLLIIQVIVATLLVIVIFIQPSEGSNLGGSPMSGFMGARSASNFLTKMTVVLATIFFVLGLSLATIEAHKTDNNGEQSILNGIRKIAKNKDSKVIEKAKAHKNIGKAPVKS